MRHVALQGATRSRRASAWSVQASARPARASDDGSSAARALDRVATLVAAGVSPPRAWELVGGFPAGSDPAWQDVAAVLRVAERTGAPSEVALRSLAGALRRSAASDRAVRVALAGPRASARVVLALPALGLALGSAWGAGAVQVLVASPVGWVCCTVAALLVVTARAWTARLVRAATPDGHVPGVLLDAWAVAVSGGGAWASGGAAVRAAFGEGHGSSDVPAWSATEAARLREVLALSRRAGVPAAALLRAAAEDVRDDAAAAGLAAAERLAVRLVLPLGVCVLPAFVLVGVVPVVVGVLSSTVVEIR